MYVFVCKNITTRYLSSALIACSAGLCPCFALDVMRAIEHDPFWNGSIIIDFENRTTGRSCKAGAREREREKQNLKASFGLASFAACFDQTTSMLSFSIHSSPFLVSLSGLSGELAGQTMGGPTQA